MNSGNVERDIPSRLLEAVKLKEHSHEVQEEDTPVDNRQKGS